MQNMVGVVPNRIEYLFTKSWHEFI